MFGGRRYKMLYHPEQIYDVVAEIASASQADERELAEFLRALAGSVPRGDAVAVEVFLDWLRGGLATQAPPDASRGPALEGEQLRSADGPGAVQALLGRQIEDLLALRDTGAFENPYRYFGTDAPSGRRWFNFDVSSYLECGAAGTFGCSDEEDVPTNTLPWDSILTFLECGQAYE